MELASLPDRMAVVSLVDNADSHHLPRLSGLNALASALAIPVHASAARQPTLLAACIDGAVTRSGRAIMLVADGRACSAAAWWSRLSPRAYVSRVAGALMIDPIEEDTVFASPRCALPFPSLVLGASDTAQRMAMEWGGRLIDGPSAVAGPRPSRRIQDMLMRFTAAIIERDIAKAGRLLEAIGDR